MPQVHYHEIVETAAFLAFEGPRTPLPRLPAQRLHEALRLSRFRLKLWLRVAESSAVAGGKQEQQQRRELVEEIFICEPPVRLLGALLTRTDGSRSGHELFPVARRLLGDHGQAKRMALRELLADSLPIGTLVQINGLRSRMERWTDLLLGVAGAGIDAVAFGFDEGRVREHRRGGACDQAQLGRLVFRGLQQAVPRGQIREGVRAEAHRSLHECFIGLISAGAAVQDRFTRTRLQQRIFGDHLTTDGPCDGLVLEF